jgi:hypothetical protein
MALSGTSLTIQGVPSARNAPSSATLQTLFVDTSTGKLYCL